MNCQSEEQLRLVVLGRAGAGKTSTVSTITGREQDGAAHSPEECSKHTGQAAGRQVTVVSSTDLFGLACDPEDRKRQLCSLLALSSPGPQAFLLCVPLNQSTDAEVKALDVLEQLLGPDAVQSHTVVLFTHTEELDPEERLEEYLLTWRKDLIELVRRCGDRYHTLETQGKTETKDAVQELLDKVDQALKESGKEHFSCQLYQDVEEQIQKKQEEILKQKHENGLSIDNESLEMVRQEAERSVEDLDLNLDALFPPSSAPVSPNRSFLWGLWEMLTGWLWRLPKLVRREALLGALVGLFVGGPVGGAVGATVGSVATEVGRRKTQKTK